jgi:nicotinate-nucleotide--dimethylbenzimidazole phosphoribosyltransferase
VGSDPANATALAGRRGEAAIHKPGDLPGITRPPGEAPCACSRCTPNSAQRTAQSVGALSLYTTEQDWEKLVGTLEDTIRAIRPLDQAAMAAAAAHQNILTKPQGSLGRLESLAIQMAGIQGAALPAIRHKAIITVAGDHGVAREGVSAYPPEVTPQMVLNFLRGGAAINVLARHVGARVVVLDAGVASDLPASPGLIVHKAGYGTASIAGGPAMTRQQAVACVEAGIATVTDEIARGLDIVGTGDMGIGNTTPSSAIVSAITRLPVSSVTGRGTGVDDVGLARKIGVIERALAVNQPEPADGLDVLAKVGGFEIGGIAGVILGAAANQVAVVIDGFISGAAALIAAAIAPASVPYMIAGHLSVEGGHAHALKHLGLSPVLDLDMRLGEGTGAALAIGIVEAATRIVSEMATFADAGVSGKGE